VFHLLGHAGDTAVEVAMAPHRQRPAPGAETVRPGRLRVGLVAVALVVVLVGLVVA